MSEKYFKECLNNIIHGSNVEVLKKFPNSCIDLTVTSPPYDAIRNYSKKLDTKQNLVGNYSFPFEELAKQLYRVTSMGGVVVWNVNDQTVKGNDGGSTETGNSFRMALYFQEVGFNIHDTMIYQKPGVRFPDKLRYHQTFEYMFVLSKGRPKTIEFINDVRCKSYKPGQRQWAVPRNKREKDDKLIVCDSFTKNIGEFGRRHNVWKINCEQSGGGDITEWNWHPAIFPSALAHDHIVSWSKEGDVVLDPFSGSGTTAIQAKITKRKFIGIDINKEYVEKSRKRLENYASVDNQIKEDDGTIKDFIVF
ncbi:MAG: DNA-methyltransferase [Elusimicrobiota bacterium]